MRMRFLLPTLAVLGFSAATPALAEIGRIKSQVGPVSISRNGTVLASRPGFELEQGDMVMTGKAGRVGIAFQDDTRMALGPNSNVRITQSALSARVPSKSKMKREYDIQQV